MLKEKQNAKNVKKISSSMIFLPPTFEKLKGHIALGLPVRPSVRVSVQNLLRNSS